MYRLEYLQIAHCDILEAELYLYEHNPIAADKFMAEVEKQEAYLVDKPYMYPVYEAKPYFRIMPLTYKYLCFYHVDEDTKIITVHRILRGMRDIHNTL